MFLFSHGKMVKCFLEQSFWNIIYGKYWSAHLNRNTEHKHNIPLATIKFSGIRRSIVHELELRTWERV